MVGRLGRRIPESGFRTLKPQVSQSRGGRDEQIVRKVDEIERPISLRGRVSLKDPK